MKKVGILTFHKAANYGAVLQAYALQQFIKKRGNNCEIIDYNNSELNLNYCLNPFKAKNIKKFVKKILYFYENKRRNSIFKQFTSDYLKISNENYDTYSIFKVNNLYDAFITGSDQVWNYKITANDKNYFLSFCNDNSKKNSYAASFGNINIIDKDIKETLNSMNNISVREDDALNKIIDLGISSKKVSQNIDPVFLLEKSKWKKIMTNIEHKKKYIFIYEVTYTDKMLELAKKISSTKNLEIYYLSASNKKVKGVKNLKFITPNEFLDYIYNAEYIITSSFHGMAFSIIFNKNFFYDIPSNANNYSSRLESLANLLHLTDRKIIDGYNMDYTKGIDYKKVNDTICEEIKKSKTYLDMILE